MQLIALRAPIDDDDEEAQRAEAEDEAEPVVGRESGNTAGYMAQGCSIVFFGKFVLQLLGVLQFYWNSDLYTGAGTCKRSTSASRRRRSLCCRTT